MPPLPDKQNKDEKEVRLFGEKSIREQAYRQKIIELEKEVMQLEAVLKKHQKPDEDVTVIEEHSDESPVTEPSVLLDEKIKKHIQELEEKANDLSEKLQSQSQELSRQKTKFFIGLFLFFALCVTVAASGIFLFLKVRGVQYQDRTLVASFYENPETIKHFLQESGFYNKQYSIITLSAYNNGYKGTVELHFKPYTNWELKIIASDIIETFKRLSGARAIELVFMYDGDTYAKANFSPVSNETHYEFK